MRGIEPPTPIVLVATNTRVVESGATFFISIISGSTKNNLYLSVGTNFIHVDGWNIQIINESTFIHPKVYFHMKMSNIT
jgi:hypothetical protein